VTLAVALPLLPAIPLGLRCVGRQQFFW